MGSLQLLLVALDLTVYTCAMSRYGCNLTCGPTSAARCKLICWEDWIL
jgi:hypothetical protein